MKPGDHGSTFAGSPLVTRVAATTFDIIRQPEFLQAVTSNGERLMQVVSFLAWVACRWVLPCHDLIWCLAACRRACLSVAASMHSTWRAASLVCLRAGSSNMECRMQGLRRALQGNAHVKEVRGLGLIVGVQLNQVGTSTWRGPVEGRQHTCTAHTLAAPGALRPAGQTSTLLQSHSKWLPVC